MTSVPIPRLGIAEMIHFFQQVLHNANPLQWVAPAAKSTSISMPMAIPRVSCVEFLIFTHGFVAFPPPVYAATASAFTTASFI